MKFLLLYGYGECPSRKKEKKKIELRDFALFSSLFLSYNLACIQISGLFIVFFPDTDFSSEGRQQGRANANILGSGGGGGGKNG